MPEEASSQSASSVIESIQSLVVAFVLAMMFRGFVTEGFVIPTGSMAPTLMGQHVLLHSEQTGVDFQVGVDQGGPPPSMKPVADPMLGPKYTGGAGGGAEMRRMGDRILVLKCIYPFAEPDRFDVVVFKNPTEPDGDSANYIKRLVGLPDEKLLLIDGDVFTAPNEPDVPLDAYRIQRKPEHVQSAVWQPVHGSDFLPEKPDRLYPSYEGSPWRGAAFQTVGRSYMSETDEPVELRWDHARRAIDDWTVYNEGRPNSNLVDVSDVRITAGVEAERVDDLEMVFELATRDHLMQFIVRGGDEPTAEVRMRSAAGGAWEGPGPRVIDLPDDGKAFSVQLWHVDQAMAIYIDRKRVTRHEYDWSGRRRYEILAGGNLGRLLPRINTVKPAAPELTWRFSGTPVTLHRVGVARDLYYRTDGVLDAKAIGNPTQEGFEELVRRGSTPFGAHPQKPAALGPDHFLMMGDNSQASLDSRLWGNPHPLVAEQIDPTPFVVNRKLIVGKAWVVYFPAPYTVGRMPVVPDFGRLRFIR